MEKQCNSNSQGDLKGFSSMIYKILGVVLVLYPLIVVSNILSELWRIFGMEADAINLWIFGLQLLRIEDSSAFIPVFTWGITIYADSPVRDFSVLYATIISAALLFVHCLIVVGIFYLRAIFKELKSGMSPFSEKMMQRILSLAWLATMLIIFEAISQRLSLTNIVLLITTWLLYYIFEHGRTLQNESDTTL
ncbi:MAG: hypothetical protein FWB87_04130 [Defluviitaleaceae bacterium]|nr:hypothetical protein [Defluviitaleaceae bacterium]